MEAGLTNYTTVLVLTRSNQPRQSYDPKSVPMCLVRSARLCHSYSVTRNLVAAQLVNGTENPCRRVSLDEAGLAYYSTVLVLSRSDQTGQTKTRKVYLCVWYALSDCVIVTGLRVTWYPCNS
jgi:hypothetical protein